MKIAVYGATGRAGREILAEAARRGHEITALSRHEPTDPLPAGVTWQRGDATDRAAVAAAVGDADAVVSAIAPPSGPRNPEHGPTGYADTVAELARAVDGTRILVIGGAGSLLTADGVRLIDTVGFPEEFKPSALAAAAALDALRALDASVDWTYLSPAPMLVPGERTGAYRTGTDSPVGDSISYPDIAIAIVDELEKPAHRRERWTVASA